MNTWHTHIHTCTLTDCMQLARIDFIRKKYIISFQNAHVLCMTDWIHVCVVQCPSTLPYSGFSTQDAHVHVWSDLRRSKRLNVAAIMILYNHKNNNLYLRLKLAFCLRIHYEQNIITCLCQKNMKYNLLYILVHICYIFCMFFTLIVSLFWTCSNFF